jgi:multidrug resistance efflux pump
MKWAIAVGLVLVVIWALSSLGPDPESGWVPVELDSSPRVIHEVGILEAKELARIQTRVRGVITELHPDGTTIKEGETILTLDREELEDRLELDLEELEQAREDYESQLAEYAVLTNTFNLQTRLKAAELRHAVLELKWGSTPLQPDEQRIMEINVELARLDLEEKQAEIVRQQELVRRNFAPPSSLDKIELELASARTYLEEQRSQLALASQPVTQEERLTLQAAVDKAEKEVKRNEDKQQLQLRIQELELEGKRLEIQDKEEDMEYRRMQLEHVEIRSPANGILLLFKDYSWSSKTWQPLSVGKQVHAFDNVATVVDPGQLSLRLKIHESDFPEVRVGQPVTAFLTAYPHEELTGVVASVSEVGQDRNELSPLYQQDRPVGQALFLVMVDLEINQANAMPGMTTHARIQTSPPADRLFIPGAALRSTSPPYQVTRRRNGAVETVSVEGTFDRLGRFEVSQGLEMGDEVKVTEGDTP